MLRSIDVRTQRDETIGEAVARAVNNIRETTTGDFRIVAVVPQILSLYADMPRRYEVTKVEVIVEVAS